MHTRQLRFGARLRELVDADPIRNNRKVLARAIGVTPAAISLYIHGKAEPKLHNLVALADFLHVELDSLVFGEQPAQSRALDYGPLSVFIDQSLSDVQALTRRHSALVEAVGRILADNIDQATAEVARAAPLHAGLITDDETHALERFSEETWILSMDLSYDVVKPTDESEAPGRALQIVAHNLARQRPYRFLVPRPAVRGWTSRVAACRNLLGTLNVHPDTLRRQCLFRQTDYPVVAGCGFYHLDVDELRTKEPFLYERVSPNFDNGWLGYTMPPSKEVQGDTVMDREYLRRGRRAFQEMWSTARGL